QCLTRLHHDLAPTPWTKGTTRDLRAAAQRERRGRDGHAACRATPRGATKQPAGASRGIVSRDGQCLTRLHHDLAPTPWTKGTTRDLRAAAQRERRGRDGHAACRATPSGATKHPTADSLGVVSRDGHCLTRLHHALA